MGDVAEIADKATATSSKKASKAAPKKSRQAPTHPKVSDMVNSAISNLKERGGSSLQAIKKYIASNYKVDVERLSPFIKKYLKTAVEKGTLVQTKGKGAAGSFKMNSTTSKKPAKPKAKSPTKKTKMTKEKKTTKSPEKKTKPKSPKPKTAKKKAPVKVKSPKVKKSKPKTPSKKAPAKKTKK